MKATITIRYQPLEPHQRTGGRNRPWLAETRLQPAKDEDLDRTGTVRAETFANALRLATAGVLSHYNQERPPDQLGDMTSERWKELSLSEKDDLRDLSGLSEQLIDLEGWRVEVETLHGETRRFIVGRSTGWRPCHLEIHNRVSSGGDAADRVYQSVRKLYDSRKGGR